MKSVLDANRFVYVATLLSGTSLATVHYCAGLECLMFCYRQPKHDTKFLCINCWDTDDIRNNCRNNPQCKEGEAVIRSPGFPFSYGQGINCTWTIDTGTSKFIKLEIVYLKLAKSTTKSELNEFSGKCKDSITFKDNSNAIGITAETQSDIRDSIIISTGPTLSITLQTCFQYEKWDGENLFEVKASRTDCPVGWHYSWYSNSCYNIYSYDVGITWPEANLKCTEQNGSLVSITSKQELEFVHLLVIKNINNIMDNKMLIVGGSKNLALGKKTYMSSVYGRFGGQYCVNGNTKDFCHTRTQRNPWLRIDLGAVNNVDKVVIYNRNVQGGRFRNAFIHVGVSINRLRKCGYFRGPGKNSQKITIKCPGGMKGRFIQIQARANTILQLADVQVFGNPGAKVGGSKNLALGKKTYMSSVYGRFGGQYCVNGNTKDFCHTRTQRNPWLRIDLGAVNNVDKVVIYNRNVQVSGGTEGGCYIQDVWPRVTTNLLD
uniref:Uncharacterized protein n=1 Tax=Magallana gigas TaxID=29159 RepID=K1PGK7_MAGGI